MTRGTRQTEMVAKGFSGVLVAKKASPSEDGYNVIDKDLAAGRKDVGHDIEAVGGSGEEPFLERVGDLLRRTDGEAMAAAIVALELAHGEFFATGEIDLRLEKAVRALLGRG